MSSRRKTSAPLHPRLLDLTPTDSDALTLAWQSAAAEVLEREPNRPVSIPEQFLILIICRDENQQVELLGRFKAEGLECKALLS